MVHVGLGAAPHLPQVEGEAHLRLGHALAGLVCGLVDGLLGDPHRLGHALDLGWALDHADLPERRHGRHQLQVRQPLLQPLGQGRIQAPFVVAEPAPVKARVLQRPDDALEEVLHRLQVDADLADALLARGERPVVFQDPEEGTVGDHPRRRDGVHHVVHLSPGNHQPRRRHGVPRDDGGDVLPAPHPAQVEHVGNIGGGEQAVEVPLGQNPASPAVH